MPKPDPLLVEIAAGRGASGSVDSATVQRAVDHRIGGLLWSRVLAGEIEAAAPQRDLLGELDLRAWARNRMLEASLAELLSKGRSLGMNMVVIKGLATANRWYDRPGERWAYDLDVVLSPQDLDGIDDLVNALYPSHPMNGQLVELLSRGHIQSVDLGVKDMPVDLHLDPFKLEILWARHAGQLWNHVEEMDTEAGLRIPTFDDDVSLLLHLVHLNKDSFRRLIGYADVARGLAASSADWRTIFELAATEGIEQSVIQTAHAVVSELGLQDDLPGLHRKLRGRIWRLTWPDNNRLMADRSDPGRHRIFILSFIATGRFFEALRGWVRRLFPPRILLDYYYPDAAGPYLIKLVRERLQRS